MIVPGSRQRIAAADSAFMFALTAPVPPIVPMASPCLPGFMLRKQAGEPR
jgi:hypothetical protein